MLPGPPIAGEDMSLGRGPPFVLQAPERVGQIVRQRNCPGVTILRIATFNGGGPVNQIHS